MRSLRSICLVVLALVAFADSTLGYAQTKLNLDDVLVVLNTNDKRYWQIDVANSPLKPLPYPAELLRSGVTGCIALGFFIEADGTTSGYRILNSSVVGSRLSVKNKRIALTMFSKAALESFVHTRFVAGPENPTKQRGFSQITYTYSLSASQTKKDGKCNIPDLALFLNSDWEKHRVNTGHKTQSRRAYA